MCDDDACIGDVVVDRLLVTGQPGSGWFRPTAHPPRTDEAHLPTCLVRIVWAALTSRYVGGELFDTHDDGVTCHRCIPYSIIQWRGERQISVDLGA